MLLLLVGTGVYLTIILFGLQFRALPYALKLAFGRSGRRNDADAGKGDVSHFGSLMTALSATIGTGNIAGVATAVVSGGPGAVFWMWVTAIFGMATKYGEGVLAVKYRTTNAKGEMSGGPMYYIERGMGAKWKWLAMAFALFGVVASFGIGSSVQSNSVAQALDASFHLSSLVTAGLLMLLTGFVILGGIRSIAKASSVIVPFMAIFYVIGGLVIIFMHLDLLAPAVQTILGDAFTGQAVAGGALGSVIRFGVARGVFSNEAGMGSAPIAAAAARTDHPVRQALVSMTGTFLDTIIVCSITGIVLVMGLIETGAFVAPKLTGAALTTETFNHMLPGPGGWIVSIGLIFFAYSTILGWCYYGEKCAAYLFGEGAVFPYRVVYVISVMLGAMIDMGKLWTLSDIFNGLMAIPNLIALLALSGVIISETKDFNEKRSSGQLT
ncbi:MAG: sodium:alanine symporter family protein [Ottowia sp.]|nr:sodium:alanine symporter family protein [Ottowia sp.]